MPATRLSALVTITVLALAAFAIPGSQGAIAGGGFGCTITVNSTGDNTTGNDVVALREAIGFATDEFEPAAGELDEISGCPGDDDNPGAARSDFITFDETVFPFGSYTSIDINTTLPLLHTGGDFIQGDGRVTVQAPDDIFACFWITSNGNVIAGLRITGCETGVQISPALAPAAASGGSPGPSSNLLANNVIVGNDRGIFIKNASSNNVAGNMIGVEEDGTTVNGNLDGVTVHQGFANVIGRGDPPIIAVGAGVDGQGNAYDQGNVISGNLQDGISLGESTGTQVLGNIIGLGFDGETPVPNFGNGVVVFDSGATRIGSSDPADRNIISGNLQDGVWIVDSTIIVLGGCCLPKTTVVGNYIGTDQAGLQPLGNGVNGVTIEDSPQNVIGGTDPGEGNLISDNAEANVAILGENATTNLVQGNTIGTDVDMLAPMGSDFGVVIEQAPGNVIGGNVPEARNIIVGAGAGVGIFGPSAASNAISGNLVGVLPDGGAMGNAIGVFIQNSGPNTIGGADSSEGNTIAHNAGAGVAISAIPAISSRKSILSNSIYDNGGLGIDLENDGVTLNDNKDPDTGANQHQNYPVLQSAEEDSGQTAVHGILNSLPNTGFKMQFFANTECDPSGFGEGRVYLGDLVIPATDGDGNAEFQKTFAVPLGGQHITATATDPDGNTSEFSACQLVSGGAMIRTWGDIDCMNGLTATDALGTLSFGAGLEVIQADQCPEIDVPIDVDGTQRRWGDWNCDGEVEADDMIRVLMAIADLSATIGDCPDVGSEVSTVLDNP